MAKRAHEALLCLSIGIALVAATAASSAQAADYKSVGDAPAVLYDAPTQRGAKLAIVPRGTPLEIIVNEGDWDRVRDASGDFSWIAKSALVDRRTVVATVPALLRAAADEKSQAIARLQPGVWVELLEPPGNGFAHVRHKDGMVGWVRVSDVWGL
jgi:SH3-like domain-containing protein